MAEGEVVVQDQPAQQITQPAADTVETNPADVVTTDVDVEKTAPTPKELVVATPPVYDFKAELKKADRREVLKELGLDDKLVALNEHYLQNGDIKPWMEAYTSDPETLSPQDVLKRQITEQYAGIADTAKIDAIYKREIGKYNIDPELFEPEEVELEILRMQKDTKPFREKMKQEQSERLIPPADKSAAAAEEQKQLVQQYQSYAASTDAAKNLLTNKAFVFGEGDEAFHLNVEDPAEMINWLTDNEAASQAVTQEDGFPDIGRRLEANAVLKLGLKNIVLNAIEHGRKLQTKAAIIQDENPKPTVPGTTGTAKKDPYAGWKTTAG